jgi:hypothetical protein
MITGRFFVCANPPFVCAKTACGHAQINKPMNSRRLMDFLRSRGPLSRTTRSSWLATFFIWYSNSPSRSGNRLTTTYAVRHLPTDRACRKQMLNNLEFVHDDAPRASRWAWRNAAVHPGSRPLPTTHPINKQSSVACRGEIKAGIRRGPALGREVAQQG